MQYADQLLPLEQNHAGRIEEDRRSILGSRGTAGKTGKDGGDRPMFNFGEGGNGMLLGAVAAAALVGAVAARQRLGDASTLQLLRTLQEGTVLRLGGKREKKVDVRLVAATHRDLPAMVAAGQFRADLFYRLNVLPIRVPPLRERLDDLDALAEHLLEDIARRGAMAPRGLAADALDVLAAHAWPGNIRELRNVLEQASLMSDQLQLDAAALRPLLPAPDLTAPVRKADTAPADGPATLPAAVAALEARLIRESLQATGGNKRAAALRLGIARATLYEKLAILDSQPPSPEP